MLFTAEVESVRLLPPIIVDKVTMSLSFHVFHTLQQRIVEGDIPPGSKISEPELAREFNVSRSSLREAIQRLEAGGLVIRTPNVGARVITLSAAKLIEIYEIREALEGMACRLAAERMTAQQIDELQQLLADHAKAESLQSGQSYYQSEGDVDFHYRLIHGSQNQQLIDWLCGELYQLVRMYRVQFGMAGPRAKTAFKEHSQIVDAIAAGDGELAEMLMRRHIAASRKNIQMKLQLQEQEDVASISRS